MMTKTKKKGLKIQKSEFSFILKKSQKNIPGLGMIFFHGRNYAGVKSEGLLSPRELDFAVFTTYKGKQKTIFFEVKSCVDDMETKKINGNRKKANTQLLDHKKILKNELDIDPDNIRCHILWPFLSSTEDCKSCEDKHERFKEKPKSCKRSAQSQPKDDVGRHIFENVFSDYTGKKFGEWFLSLLEDDNKVQQESDWQKLLGKFVQLSCGALFDEIEKNFVLLGTDQINLVSLPAHDLSSPRFIAGTAGTGKTLTTIAKITELYQHGKITEDEKAIYICSSNEVIKYVKGTLRKQKVDSDNIIFVNWRNQSSNEYFWNSEAKFKEMVVNYTYIFFDEAEDCEIWKLNKFFFDNKSNQNLDKLGHFWILYDPLQYGSCYRGPNIISARNCFKLRLNTIFRSSRNCHMYLKADTLIQMHDPGDTIGHCIDGRLSTKLICDYTEEFNEGGDNYFKSSQFKEKVLQAISEFVIDKCARKGVHPGDIAITYDEYHDNIITSSFNANKCNQDPESEMIEELCEFTRNNFANKNTLDHGVPLATTEIDESLLFNHDVEAVRCKCKYFVGPYTKIKGLSAKVVGFISIIGDRIGRNRLASYVSLSRSTCSITMMDFFVPFLNMDNFLFNSLKFHETKNEAYMRGGFAITKFTCSDLNEYKSKVLNVGDMDQDSFHYMTSERGQYKESYCLFMPPRAVGDALGTGQSLGLTMHHDDRPIQHFGQGQEQYRSVPKFVDIRGVKRPVAEIVPPRVVYL